MGIQSYKWGWCTKTISPVSKLVLMALCSYAKDCGCCYPSTRVISQLTGIAQRTVQSHLKRLVDEGYVVRTKRGKGRTHSGFQLQLNGFGVACSVSGCGAKTSSGAPSISISKDIDTRTKNIELADGVSLFKTPEWLEIIDLTTDVNLVENANHPSIVEYISDIEKDFASIDLLAEAKKYALWWEGKKASKPKLAFRNWLEKASNHVSRPIQRVSKGTSTTVSNIIDQRTKQIAEQQRKLRESF